MKTRSKRSLFLLAVVAIVAVSCKGKSNSSSSSNSETAVSAKGNSVMDSLRITDPDEKKVCALYDDAITDYIKEFKNGLTDTSKDANARREALDQKWKEKEKEIQPQIEALRVKMNTVPTEAAKFVQFSAYESQRLMGIMAEYQKAMMKNLPSGK
jgi:FtsZ-binding cell division protein ZapB